MLFSGIASAMDESDFSSVRALLSVHITRSIFLSFNLCDLNHDIKEDPILACLSVAPHSLCELER